MKEIILSIVVCLITLIAPAQNLTQTVRGRVVDQDSKMPAIGAIISIVGTNPTMATSTDIDGYYKIENVPLGRISLKVTSLGYEDKTIPNIQISSGKETIINISIIEAIGELTQIEVKAEVDKKAANNEMSLVSSRLISVEETKRYAGTANDPARMVSSFAGVNGDAEGRNDIVVRGNSPKGILWRMEGIEIPNPNHFGEEGTSGGGVSALNSVMLANSDFSTGAFAPEYGNAMSGVMDMKLRTGNNQQREYTFGIGVLGTDITLEGPFKKEGKSSYIANYRYSSLGLLDDVGIIDFGGVPRYQDGSFKLSFPTKKAGSFSVFGLGGISNILDETYSENEDTLLKTSDFRTNMGILGIGHIFFISDRIFLNSKVSIATNGSGSEEKRMDSTTVLREDENSNLTKDAVRISTFLNWKLNAKNRIETGLIYTYQNYSFFAESMDYELGEFVTQLDDKGNTGYTQAYTSWKYRVNKDVTLVAGAHYLQLLLNNAYSIEPRLSAKWQIAPRHSMNAGFGVHSKVESLLSYFAQIEQQNGIFETVNTNLKLPKARHYVVGYDYGISENAHVKIEAYYQFLYDIAVENDINSFYSTLNSSDGYNDVELVNEGTGENYGVELTLERFFANNFYYLLTGSVYNSSYKALDGKVRNTRYNGGFASNFLIGKEFVFGERKNKVLNLSTRIGFAGGNRYTPLDLQNSRLNNRSIYFTERTYEKQGGNLFILNIGANYQINRQKTTHIMKLEILNTTNNQAKLYEYYDRDTDDLEYGTQLNMIPNIIYQIQF